MNKRIYFLMVLLMASVYVFAQGPHQRPAVLREVSNQQVVQSVYPDASTVKKSGAFWYKILNEKGKILGYALNSTDYCKDVKGHSGATPVMIVTDKKFVIQKVSLLSSFETDGFVKRLETSGFFNKWNGKALRKAKLDKLDGYTGATMTARAVEKNVNFLLENGGKKLP
jgi:Na+-translocating ferredoxin:NAD+ oxidoreductase RnfG subunit